jgi:flagellar basal body-associated protein FliL
MNANLTDKQTAKGSSSSSVWPMAAIAIMVVVVVLLLSGYAIVNDSGSKTTTAANSPAPTGFAPIIDEVRPVPKPSTVGQGGERR